MSGIQIIDNPRLKGLFQTLTEWTFTTAMWALWIYLFLPLLNVVLWLSGVHFFYESVIQGGGYLHLLGLLRDTGISLVVVVVLLRGWGYYNYVRFGRRNRRKAVAVTTPDDLARFFQLPPDAVVDLQGAKEITWTGQWRNDHRLCVDDFVNPKWEQDGGFSLPSEALRVSLAR